jgi:ssDNA-binding Zn-finger/Zn-ribbon topoisomerase 1
MANSDTTEPTTEATYTQLRVKCMKCGLHFIICTWFPEQHAPTTMYCPECGQHPGKRGNGTFSVWQAEVEGFIFQAVPGEAELTYMLGNPIPKMDAEEKEAWDKLREEVNQNNKKLLEGRGGQVDG